MSYFLPPNHFLSLPRQNVSHLGVVPDTSTLAAHDFDVDVRTGFMPPSPPLERLPSTYSIWEQLLDDISTKRFKVGERKDLTERDRDASETWRRKVQQVLNNNNNFFNYNIFLLMIELLSILDAYSFDFGTIQV